MRTFGLAKVVSLVLATVVLAPAVAYGQASITGVVRDSSGGVLPGVTVEAASPALIEKVRSVVSDGSGQYRIVDLRPGPYSVTFTLPGFSTFKREGVELTGSLTATINAEMRVGGVEETITVTGESPIVDLQSTTRQAVLDKDTIDALPTGRLHYNLAVLVPGVQPSNSTQQDVGGSNGDLNSTLVTHGSRADSQRVTQNGLSVATAASGGQFLGSAINMASIQEVTVDTAAVSAEQSTGGVRINFIPREGGSRFTAAFFGAFANKSMQSDNFTDDLERRGLGTPGGVDKNWDVNPGGGGPLIKDRLWFYVSGRHSGADNYVSGLFVNLNANNPDVWTYAPGAPSGGGVVSRNVTTRWTWQANQNNKFGFTWEASDKCGCRPVFYTVATRSPEASAQRNSVYQRMWGADWWSPVTNRLLFEAGFMGRDDRWGNFKPEGLNPLMIPVTEQSTGLTYRAWTTYNSSSYPARTWRVAVSYVTGAHAFKVGYNDGMLKNEYYTFDNQPLAYRFNNGAPNQITMFATPFYRESRVDHDLGLYAQDKWTLGRMTLSFGVRYDYLATSFPEQVLGPAPLTPNRNITFPAQSNINWKDVTPKLGAVYDVFGDGKTALRVSLNKFVAGQGAGGIADTTNPVLRLAVSTTRSWNDANQNFTPDCNLLNLSKNGECGTVASTAFGTLRPETNIDPNVLTGFGNRGSDWEFAAGVQHEVLPRVSVDVGYFRRWFGNLTVTDNRAVSAADFDSFSITAPADPRLPGGGGHTISGLKDLNPAKVGQVDNILTFADNFGRQVEHWNGVDISVRARLRNGLLLQGGTSTGRTSTDNCEVVAMLPELSPRPSGALGGQPYCHVDGAFLTQVKLLGSYTVPKFDVLLSGTFQSLAGPQVTADYVVSSAVAAQSLGRPLSGGAANATVNLVQPGTMYGERMNQVDFRIGKVLRFSRTKTSVNLDLYNALNSSAVLAQSNQFANWQQPQQILQARFAKISVQWDF